MNAKTEQLTYRQISNRLGLSIDAARARARRGGWLKITDNRGIVRVSVPADALTTPNVQGEQPPKQPEPATPNSPHTDGVSAELMNTLCLAVTTLQRELDRRAEEAAHDKEELYRLRDDIADLRARLAVAESLLTERETPTDGVNVGVEQISDVQVNVREKRPPRTWWQRLLG